MASVTTTERTVKQARVGSYQHDPRARWLIEGRHIYARHAREVSEVGLAAGGGERAHYEALEFEWQVHSLVLIEFDPEDLQRVTPVSESPPITSCVLFEEQQLTVRSSEAPVNSPTLASFVRTPKTRFRYAHSCHLYLQARNPSGKQGGIATNKEEGQYGPVTIRSSGATGGGLAPLGTKRWPFEWQPTVASS